MRLVEKLRLRGRTLFRRGRVERELGDELRFHLEQQIAENLAAGMSAEEARYAARRSVGGAEQIKEECRDMRGVRYIENFLQDIRYGVRQLRRRPGFAALVVLILAVGVGTNTTFFSIIDGLLLRPPANVVAPERLVALYQTVAKGGTGGYMNTWSYPDYLSYRNGNAVFSELAAYSPFPVSIGVEGSNTQTVGEMVSGNYFAALGTKAFLGRMLAPVTDDTPTSLLVAIASYEFWRSRFGSDPSAVGKLLTINGRLFTLIGVAPKGTTDVGLQMAPAVWVPLAAQPAINWPESGALESRGTGWLTVLGRLKPDVTRQQALSHLSSLATQLDRDYSGVEQGRGISVEPATALPPFFRGSVIGFVVLLQVLGALLLLIPCANVGGLLLARSWSRQKEITIRLAIGASRSRIMRQLLTESMLTGLLSGAAGLLLAFWGAEFLTRLKPPVGLPIALNLQPDLRVLGYTLAVVAVTVLLLGIAPALRLSRTSLAPQLGNRSDSGSGRRSKGQRLLLVVQVSVSFLLLAGAGLCVRSLRNAERTDPGFETRNVLTFSVSPALNGYTRAREAMFYRELGERLKSLEAVRSISMAASLPLSYGEIQTMVGTDGRSGASTQPVPVGENLIASGYFETIGIPILRGRGFFDADGNQNNVIVINETLAHRFFPAQDPIGKQLALGDAQHPRMAQIVGIARDSKYHTLGEPAEPFLYEPLVNGFEGPAGTTVLVRTSVAPQALVLAIRNELRALDKNLPVTKMETMSEHIRLALWLARTAATLFGIVGTIGVFLAMVGLYGTVAYSVVRRTNEIGIRMALGAQRMDVLKMVVREGLLLTFAGMGIGLAAALALTRFLGSLLYGISATDPATFATVSILLVAVALAACYIPARRASRVDPTLALRCE
jgi:macrolide transport system ATP-binding/permease protein